MNAEIMNSENQQQERNKTRAEYWTLDCDLAPEHF